MVGGSVARPGRPKKLERAFSVPDLVGVGFLSAFCPAAVVDRILREMDRLQQRSRLLPSRLVV